MSVGVLNLLGSLPLLALGGVAVWINWRQLTRFTLRASTANAEIALVEIRAVLDKRVQEWQAIATCAPVRLSTVDVGFDHETDVCEVYYGNGGATTSQRFYLFAFNVINTGSTGDETWAILGYAFVPGTDKADGCAPGDWSVLSDRVVQGDWHAVIAVIPAQPSNYMLKVTARLRHHVRSNSPEAACSSIYFQCWSWAAELWSYCGLAVSG